MADNTDTTSTSVAAADTTPATAAAGAPSKGAKGAAVAKTADVVTDPGMGDYTVAKGRTVIGDDGEAKKPGETVSLNAKDAKRMLALGFILDADGSIVIQADGPAVNVEDGVQIAQPA